MGYWLRRIDETIDERLDESGVILDNAYRGEIDAAGLIDTGDFIGSVTHVKEGNEVRSGTPIDNPPYPVFLEFGFRHHISGEIVGPYRPLTKAASASEGPLRALWKQPMKG